MSWRNRLVDASFKNIPFKVLSSDYGVGRRTELHQFANRDKPFVQDLGGDAEDFVVEGYIVQNIENSYDYFTERDNLIRVLKSKGSGTLIHPFYGIKKVSLIGKARIVETFDEGGIARFTMNFSEAGDRALPTALTDFISSVDNAINQGMDVVGDAFATAYDTVALFQDVSQNAISRAVGSVQTCLTGMTGIATKVISESVGNVNLIRNATGSIINSPNDIFNALKDSCYSMASACGMGETLIKEQQNTSGYKKNDDINTNARASDIFAGQISISTTTTGGETGTYSGITRGNVVELKPDSIPEDLGKSVIQNIIDTIENYDMSGYGITPEAQQRNLVLILDTFKFCMIATICRIAIRTEFFGQEEIISYMEAIVDLIDLILIDLGAEAAGGSVAIGVGTSTEQINNKDIFNEIENIKNVFVENMLLKSSGVVKTLDYVIPTDIQTTLELAYNKYLDLDRAKEIYDRNRPIIQHPGFMPGGDTIRILEA